MNKQEIYAFLTAKGLWHEITEHRAVYTVAELSDIAVPYPEADAKNLFVRDDKKQNYYLITVKGNKRADLKAFRKANQTRPLSFAPESELLRILGLTAGSVTPFGILNDAKREAPGLIGVHPNDNTATVWLKAKDLAGIIQEHGNELYLVQI